MKVIVDEITIEEHDEPGRDNTFSSGEKREVIFSKVYLGSKGYYIRLGDKAYSISDMKKVLNILCD